jgi:hypothetical protein
MMGIVTSEPSNFIKGAVNEIIEKNKDDALKICLEIDGLLITGMCEELVFNEAIIFADKFQLIADLKYCSDVIEQLIDVIQKAVDDPYYFIIGLLGDDE